MSGESAYVTELAEVVGPRPATTDAEARAAEWLTEVFAGKGLQVDRQEIDTPRTDSWGLFICYVLAMLAAIAAGFDITRIAALLVALVAVVLTTLDMTARFSLASILPKGPSQNIIAKHVPRSGRNERARKVVVVACLDSARPSLITNTPLVRSQRAIAWVTLVAVWLVLLFTTAMYLPWKPFPVIWMWYLTLVPAIWLLFPIVVVLHRELVMKASPGANADASGVAAMIGVVDRLIPDKAEVVVHAAAHEEPVRQGEEVVWAADLVPEDSSLSYSPASAPDRRPSHAAEEPAGRAEAEPGIEGARPDGVDTSSVPDRRGARPSGAGAGGPTDQWLDTGTIEWTEPSAPRRSGLNEGPMGRDTGFDFDHAADAPPASRGGVPASEKHLPFDDSDPLLDDAFGDSGVPRRRRPDAAGSHDIPGGIEAPPPSAGTAPDSGGKAGEEKEGVFGWLGVDKGWDARKKGAEIGSWDKFEDEEDDDIGWKGGTVPEEGSRGTGSLWDQPAPEPVGTPVGGPGPAPVQWAPPTPPPVPSSELPPLEDPGFTTEEIARIRRKVTQGVDRDLTEKEIWFVATGAGEVGGAGMKEFLKSYGDELKDAYFLGMYCVGTGSLGYISEEGGPISKVRADRRLVTAAKRVAREQDMPVKGRTSRWAITDIFVAKRRGMKAISVMAFDVNGRLGAWRSLDDTPDHVGEEQLALAADYVTALIRDL
jgi:hypothetical protein